jgi:hypothetical protein
MMPPGHVAITWGVARAYPDKIIQNWLNLDYRLLGLCALAPDIIDKPLAILVFTEAHTSQLVAHSLLLSVPFWWLRCYGSSRAIPYLLAFSAHLIADRMWNHTESFWWPLLRLECLLGVQANEYTGGNGRGLLGHCHPLPTGVGGRDFGTVLLLWFAGSQTGSTSGRTLTHLSYVTGGLR